MIWVHQSPPKKDLMRRLLQVCLFWEMTEGQGCREGTEQEVGYWTAFAWKCIYFVFPGGDFVTEDSS